MAGPTATLKVGLRLPRMTLTLSSLGGQTVSQLGLPGPAGGRGPKGDLGPTVVWRGAYSPIIAYAANDGVSFAGSSYVTATPCQGAAPPDAPWQLIADRGEKGEKGDTGDQGIRGLQGIPGVPAVWRGAYDPAVEYAANDAVVYQGGSHVALEPTLGVAPPSAPWMTVALQGVRGLDGATGVPAGWWVSTRPPPKPVTYGQFLQNLGLGAEPTMAEITIAWQAVGGEVAGYYVWDDPTGLYLDPSFAQDAAALVGTVLLIPAALQAQLVAGMHGAMALVAPSRVLEAEGLLAAPVVVRPAALDLSVPASALDGLAVQPASSHVVVWFYQEPPAFDGAPVAVPPALALSAAPGLLAGPALVTPAALSLSVPAAVLVAVASMPAPSTSVPILDNFSANTITNYTTDGGAWDVSGGVLRALVGSGLTVRYSALRVTGKTDGYIEADLQAAFWTNNYPELHARKAGGSQVILMPSAGAVYVYQNLNGTWTQIGTWTAGGAPDQVNGQSYKFRLTFAGAVVTVHRNGALIINCATDVVQAGGWGPGIGTNSSLNAYATFDNLAIG